VKWFGSVRLLPHAQERAAAGQGLTVCRAWRSADSQSGQFPKAGNSLPFVLLQSFSAMPGA